MINIQNNLNELTQMVKTLMPTINKCQLGLQITSMMELRYAQGLDNNSSMVDGKLDHGQVGGTYVKGCGNLNTKGIELVPCEVVLKQTNVDVGGRKGQLNLQYLTMVRLVHA
jgi:hypothetical protein